MHSRPLVATYHYGPGLPHEIVFRYAALCKLDKLMTEISSRHSLPTDSFYIQYKNDDHDLIDITTEDDLDEAIEFFQSGSDARSHSSGGTRRIVLQLTIYTDAMSLSGSSSQAIRSRGRNHSSLRSDSSSVILSGYSADISDTLENLQIQDPVRSRPPSERDRNEAWVQDQRRNSLSTRLGGISHISAVGISPVMRGLTRRSQIRPGGYPASVDSLRSSPPHDSGFEEIDVRHGLEPVPETSRSQRSPPLLDPPESVLVDSAVLPDASSRRRDHLNLPTYCSNCSDQLNSLKYVCKDCGENHPMSDKGKSRGINLNSNPASHPINAASSSISDHQMVEQGYELCAECLVLVGLAHAIDPGDTPASSPTIGSLSTEASEWRRSAPKERGQSRHSFIERIFDSGGWSDVGQFRTQCSHCNASIDNKQHYQCSQCDVALCRGCYFQVHLIDPNHVYRYVPGEPNTELPLVIDDLDDESSLKHHGFTCAKCSHDIVGDRYQCSICKSVNLCSDCKSGGAFDLHSSDGRHLISHEMRVFPLPTDSEEMRHISHKSLNHQVLCKTCDKIITGTRYQCAVCPSSINAYSLCASCEVISYMLHDPMHCFFKLPRPVDVELRLTKPLLSLYTTPAGPTSDSSEGDPTDYLQNLKHDDIHCNNCMDPDPIQGTWFRCANCAWDLCEACESQGVHDSTHIFLVFKSRVSNRRLRLAHSAVDLQAAHPPPIIPYTVYTVKERLFPVF